MLKKHGIAVPLGLALFVLGLGAGNLIPLAGVPSPADSTRCMRGSHITRLACLTGTV